MAVAKKSTFTCQITEEERSLLEKYCEQEGRNKVDIVREFIRSLKGRIKSDRTP